MADKLAVAQRDFTANDAGATCHALRALVHEARDQDAQGQLGPNVVTRITAYANAIQTDIGCHVCD